MGELSGRNRKSTVTLSLRPSGPPAFDLKEDTPRCEIWVKKKGGGEEKAIILISLTLSSREVFFYFLCFLWKDQGVMPTVARGNQHVPALSKSPAHDESVACVGFFFLSRETEFYYLCRLADEAFSSTPIVFSIKSALLFQWKVEVNLWWFLEWIIIYN